MEEQGIRRARATAAAADLCLWLLDRSAPPVWPSEPLAAVLYVINKSDLPPVWDTTAAPDTVRVSALTARDLLNCVQVWSLVWFPIHRRRANLPFTLVMRSDRGGRALSLPEMGWKRGGGQRLCV